MNKAIIIIVSLILALALGLGGCITASAPTPTHIETQFSVAPGEIHRLNIYTGEGQTIEGSWKSTESTYVWYLTPGGIPMLQGGSGNPITPPPYSVDNQGTESRPMIGGTYGQNFGVKVEGDYNGPGYYTFCFMPFAEERGTIEVILRYRVK